MSAAPVEVELDKVASLVATARRLVSAGKMVDLSALEGNVRALCHAVEALGPDSGRALLDRLVALVAGLDRLGEVVKEQHAYQYGPQAAPARPEPG